MRLLTRRELAEEACTDAWCRILEGRWQPTGSFRGFLFTVLHRQCLQVLRRQSTWGRLQLKWFHEPAVVAVDESLVAAGEQRRVQDAVEALPEAHRSVLLLFYSQELSSQEVAQVLECSDQQVRSKLAYARKLLRTSLTEES